MPKIVDHHERRRRLAAVAMRVAVEQGIDALTIRSVASAAGCSPSALAHYFTTKADLLIAVQRTAGEASLARIRRCFEQLEGREMLEGVVMTVLPLDPPRRAEWRLWLAYFARAAEEIDLARVQQGHYLSWRSDLRRAFQIGCGPEADLSRADLDLATDATMTLIQGLGVLGMFEPARTSPSRQRRLVRAHLDRWLPHPPSQER